MPPVTSATASQDATYRSSTTRRSACSCRRAALEVVETPPELKGGTATKRPKPAKLNTGIEIQVPEYIANGEKVWVNTTTGEFAGRAD